MMKGFESRRHELNPSSALYRQCDLCVRLLASVFLICERDNNTVAVAIKVKDMAVKCLACGTSVMIKG